MAIDPRIILGSRPIETPDALQTVAQVQQIQGMQQAQQAQKQALEARKMQMDEAARAAKDQEILQKAYQEAAGDYEKLPMMAAKLGARAKTVMELDKERLQRRIELQKLDDAGLAARKYKNSQFLGLIREAEALPEEKYLAQYSQIAARAKELNPDLQIGEEPIPKDKLSLLKLGMETEEARLAREEGARRAKIDEEKLSLDRTKLREGVSTTAANLLQRKAEEEGRNTRAAAANKLRESLKKFPSSRGGGTTEGGVTDSAKRWADRIEAGDAKVENVPLRERNGVLQALEGRDINRKISEGAVNKLAESKSAIASLQDLRKTLLENEKYIGPIAGLQALNPYSDARKAQAAIDLVRQRVGKALEGGVLRKEDEEKYKKILATLRDEPATAISKVDGLIATLERDMDIFRKEQQAAGRVTKSNPPAATGGSVDLKKLSTDDLFKRLNQ